MSYDNGPALALWWLDGYLDLDDAQEAAARPLLREWFAWHRATQLPQYARWLATWRERAAGEVNADEVCRWSAQTREALWTATERALPAGAQLLPTLKPAQLDHLAAEMADKLADERRKRAQPSAEDRRAAALERAIDSAEELYGTITDAQQRLLADAVARSPMDAVRWLDDRERRQRRFIDDLRRARVLADEATRLAALRAAAQALSQPADADTAALQARWQAHGCEVSARLHATTTPAQRQHLRERLSAWAEDVAALVSRAAP
ncbi:MAG: hypothetical protein H6933_20810 [Burkholderiaceae bacterium]|nr:hypothetical protein [Burkholderiaceae bacterium]